MLEEAVPRFRDVLGAALEDVHDADDRGERRPELMGGVLDELALAPPRLLALGHVFDDQDRVLRLLGGRDTLDPERPVLGPREAFYCRRLRVEQARRQLPQR